MHPVTAAAAPRIVERTEPVITGIVLCVSAQLRLAPDPSSVAVARHFVADTLRTWGCAAFVDAVQLVVSELVGNGVRHAHTILELAIRLDAVALRVSVRDGADAPIHRVHPGALEPGGRGLELVERLSDHSGVDYHPEGKSVWAEWSRVA